MSLDGVTILDRVHTLEAMIGSPEREVPSVHAADRVRLTVEARCAALDAAVRLVADGHTKWAHRAPLDLAESFEAWILRREGS